MVWCGSCWKNLKWCKVSNRWLSTQDDFAGWYPWSTLWKTKSRHWSLWDWNCDALKRNTKKFFIQKRRPSRFSKKCQFLTFFSPLWIICTSVGYSPEKTKRAKTFVGMLQKWMYFSKLLPLTSCLLISQLVFRWHHGQYFFSTKA